jgi:branched-chain amino acid transport system permease protein
LRKGKTNLKKVPLKKLLVLIIFLFLIFLPLKIRNPYFLHCMILTFYFAALGESWNIISGYSGAVSLGHAAFLSIGAYTSTLLLIHCNLSPWIGMFLGGGLAALGGLIISYPAFKLKGPYFVLSTVAFAEILRFITSQVKSLGGASGLLIPLLPKDSFFDFQFVTKIPYYYIILLFASVNALISYKIENSKMGIYLMAIRENRDAAQMLGVNIAKYLTFGLCLSAFLTGMIGAFYVQYMIYISPGAIMGVWESIKIALVAIIGGMGTFVGPLIGAVLYFWLGEGTRLIFGAKVSGLSPLIYGLALILAIMIFPRGLVFTLSGLLEKIRHYREQGGRASK